MNTAGIFPAPRGQAARRLMELAGRHAQLTAEARQHRQAAATATAERDQAAAAADHQAAEALAFGTTTGNTTTTAKRIAGLEKAIDTANQRARTATTAATLVEQEMHRHARATATELTAEMGEDAHAAHQALTTTIRAFTHAWEAYTATGIAADHLGRLTDPDRHRASRVPDPPQALRVFAHAAHQAADQLPIPDLTPLGAPPRITPGPIQGGSGVVDLTTAA
jgi:hypothetical protein